MFIFESKINIQNLCWDQVSFTETSCILEEQEIVSFLYPRDEESSSLHAGGRSPSLMIFISLTNEKLTFSIIFESKMIIHHSSNVQSSKFDASS